MALVGAVVVILNSRDDVLILRRPPIVAWAPNKWAFPGGKLECDESPLTAAIRETKEETDLDIRNLKIINLKIDNPIAPYYTRHYSGIVKIDFEHTAWAWASSHSVRSFALAPTVLELYEWVLKNG